MKRNARPRYARPNNNQLITYYLPVCYLLRIQQYSVNATYNNTVGILLFTNVLSRKGLPK